jgi:ammonia channel protein AmtB
LAVELIKSLNNLQLIYGGVSAIGIAIGFLMINTGTISLKNTKTMLRVSLIENMVCAICIWCLGYQISMDSIGGLIGTGLDFNLLNSVPDNQSMKFIVLFACA